MVDQQSFPFADGLGGDASGGTSPVERHPPRAVARRTDPHTSWEAAASLNPKLLSKIQEEVLAFFRRVGRATDEQMIEALRDNDYANSSLQTRRCELVRLGYLRDSGVVAVNRRGRNMIVWELVA